MLTARLKDPDVRVRVAAAVALGQFGPDAAAAVPALLDALDGRDGIHINDFSVASKAARALQAIGPDAAARMADRLFVLLGDADEDIRDRAGDVFLDLGPNATPRLARSLTDPSTARVVKVEVLRVLAEEYGAGASGFPEAPAPELREATPALKALTHDEEPEIRADARKLLAVVEPSRESPATLLLEAAREEDPDNWNFHQAIDALEPEAVGVMIDGLKDPDEEVRTVAAHALAALAEKLPRPDDEPEPEKPDPAEIEARARGLLLRTQAADALVLALKDSDTQVRWAAAWALYSLGTGETSVPALIEVVKDRTTRVRSGAVIRLTPVLGGGNGNRSERPADGELLRVGAIQALGGFGASAAPAVPALIDAMRDDDRLTRWYAAAVLGEIGPKARTAVPELIDVLRSKDALPTGPGPMGIGRAVSPSARLAVVAAESLGKIGPDARAAVAALTEALADPDELLRDKAAAALGDIGADAVAAIPALVRALDDPGWWVGDNAAKALGQVGPAAVPALIEALHGSKPDVRRRALTSLGEIGPKAAAALPDLIRALVDPDEEIRTVAAEAIGLIGNGPDAVAAVPGLLAALEDTDRLVRKDVAEALGKLGPRDDRIVPSLIATMRDSDREVRGAARDALATIGMPAFPALRRLLRDEDIDLRDDAALALAQIANPAYHGPDGETGEQARTRIKTPRAALLAALKDPDERIRAGASRALGYIGKDAVPELVVALSDPSPLARLQASRALGYIGRDASPAFGPLRERLGDPDPEVRRAAKESINIVLRHDP